MLTVNRFLLAALLIMTTANTALSQPTLSIYEIQSNTTNGDASIYNGQVVNCTGGVVVQRTIATVPRLILQDPAHPDAWGGIQVKDRYGTGAFNEVQVGDWVEIHNIYVEEFRGTTFLQWYSENGPYLTVTAQNLPIPDPVIVSVSDVPAPLYDSGDDTWFVENHNAEPRESMRVTVRDVVVDTMDLGKASDNYVLINTNGELCWASDYNNEDIAAWDDYHDFVTIGQHFCAITGLLEQYTNLSTDYDYYQILTLFSEDLAICGDGDNDGLITIEDAPRMTECITGPMCTDYGQCIPPAWTQSPTGLSLQHCLMMDPDYDGDVDLADFAIFQSFFQPMPSEK